MYVLPLQNTPDDLQLLSDAPAHHLFVLLPPVTKDQTTLPDVLCVLQVQRTTYIDWSDATYTVCISMKWMCCIPSLTAAGGCNKWAILPDIYCTISTTLLVNVLK